MYIEKIEEPADLKNLSVKELETLSYELRQTLLKKLSEHGGHIGPNLGMVEATVALHYVFNSPIDKIVFDVSHQSYVHKMLTGRKEAFIYPEKYDEVSGYSEPNESKHDFFVIGHTSTSISLSCGLAKARDLKDDKENIIAVIGDGSLSGGEAYEGLNNAAVLGSNIIIVVNDNQMSIAENHGGMYKNLQLLRETDGKAECNFFKTFGFDYLYVKEGNNVQSLIEAFSKVKDIDHPTVVHINTVKGKGYRFVEENKEKYHAGGPFDLATGKSKIDVSDKEDYGNLTAKYLLEKMKEDKTLVAITSATPTVFGFNPERRKQAGKQFIDVGIAEEHAVAMASGIATNGGKPVYGVFSTFIQRTYDQLSQDLCINNNPALILVFWASISSMTDVTHLGYFDIPLISNIPNMVYLAPTNKEEYFAMMEWGIKQTSHPVAIRVPANGVISSGEKADEDYGLLNRYKITAHGSKVAILGLGSFYKLGESVVEELKNKANIDATLINPRYITGLDTAVLEDLKKNHTLVVTLEDGVLDGGFGEKIARFYGPSDMKVLNFGVKKEFVDRFSVDELLKENHLTTPQITADILNVIK
jgi:1-deoxy-D-xylulose-5-phosphate synthase